MSKARLKSILLVGLVFSSIVLTCYIWFSEKLWPEGYNFFANMPFSFGKPQLQSTLTKETLSDPKRVVVTNAGNRRVYAPDTPEGNALMGTVKQILKLAVASSDGATAPNDEWNGALKNKCMHVVYPVAYDSRLFANILGVQQPGGSVKTAKEFIIFAGDIVSSDISVYSRDVLTGEIVKIPVKWDRTALEQQIAQAAPENTGAGQYAYSFELHFDDHVTDPDQVELQQTDGSSMQKAYLESDVLVTLDSSAAHIIKEINPLYDNDYNRGMIEEILRCFGFNVSGARKYMESDNSIVYVENYGTLKIHPDGLIEYRALDPEKGLPLSAASSGASYGSMLSCVDFVNTLWNSALPGIRLNLNISSDVVEMRSRDFTLTMDYYAEGSRVNMAIPQTNAHEAVSHAVEIQVTDDRIVSYRQVMTYFEPTEETVRVGSAITALDHLIADNQLEGGTISDLYLTYVPSGSTLWQPVWAATVGHETVPVIGQ